MWLKGVDADIFRPIFLEMSQYELSRAKEKVRLAKRGEQSGFHGLGAYEADVYYNEVFRCVTSIKEKLKTIEKSI